MAKTVNLLGPHSQKELYVLNSFVFILTLFFDIVLTA